MPMDYRVTLECGHTYDYRTVVHPMERERLTCLDCGPDQQALSAVSLSDGACLFDVFAPQEEVAGAGTG